MGGTCEQGASTRMSMHVECRPACVPVVCAPVGLCLRAVAAAVAAAPLSLINMLRVLCVLFLSVVFRIDTDCTGYCMNDPSKTAPYYCHMPTATKMLFIK